MRGWFLATLFAGVSMPALAANLSPSDIVLSDGLTRWLHMQDGLEDAHWRVFDLMHDVDQEGGLRPERLRADMDRMTLDHVSEVIERVMRSDIDDDGGVTLEEITAMEPAREPNDLRQEFAAYDADGDGRADRAAVSAGARSRAEDINAASPLPEMATWDLDGDRVASRAEIRAVLEVHAPELWPAR